MLALVDHAGIVARQLEAARRDVADLESEFSELADPDEPSLDDEHDAEGSTVGYERARIAGLLERARRRIDELEAAADRIGAGSFGSCEGCGKPIGDERLAALPGTRRCVGCAARR